MFIPSKIVVFILRFLERLLIPFPIKAEQVERLNENKIFDHSLAKKYFKFYPKSFKEGINLEVKEYLKILTYSLKY